MTRPPHLPAHGPAHRPALLPQPPLLPLWAAVGLAAASGPILDAASPDKGIWPLAFVGIALVLLALRGRSADSAFLVGFVAGAAYFFPHISWAAVFLGPLPWSALSVLMSLWGGLGGVAIAWAYRWVPVRWPGEAARLVLLPVTVAGLWVAREAISAVWPYGGFSWGRVAFTQSDSPLAQLFAWLGVSGVGFVMVALVAALIEIVLAGAWRCLLSAALTVLVLLLIPAWTSLPGTTGTQTLRVGAVQGDTKAGYFDPPENRGDNLRGQIAATEPVYAADVDVVVWPEGSSDLNPLAFPEAAAAFDAVAARADAPLVAGIITARDQGYTDANGDEVYRYYNTSTLWHAGEGQLDYYDKKHPVPFGEYVPDRAFWRMFAPDLIDLIGREYTPGTTDAVLDVGSAKTGGRSVLAGIAICFDIVDDQLMTEMVEQGAQVVFAQTNNADFGRTDESVQQLAIARIRAIETARTVVNISTVGTSAIVHPDGSVHDQLPWYEPGVMVDDVPLATTVTPAVAGGRQLEWLVSFGALIVLVFAAPIASTGPRTRDLRRSS
ncbi:MAG: apolipoprotein N-acyltransferase [Microbacteriaceae bacterium]|nr:apolipoprotein N-acyltransferase [Microbacteriaceae bacterium]